MVPAGKYSVQDVPAFCLQQNEDRPKLRFGLSLEAWHRKVPRRHMRGYQPQCRYGLVP